MAHKSKTQRAKASAAKANKKDRQVRDEAANVTAIEQTDASDEKSKRGQSKKEASANKQEMTSTKKAEAPKKKKKKHFQFFRDVHAEMKRVTWPTRQDVIRWTGVVVGALIFFGVYVAILDNLIITPALVALSGLGA